MGKAGEAKDAAINPPPTAYLVVMISLAHLLTYHARRVSALVTHGKPRLSPSSRLGHTTPGLTNDCGLDGNFIVR